jgi:hypothetical protein
MKFRIIFYLQIVRYCSIYSNASSFGNLYICDGISILNWHLGHEGSFFKHAFFKQLKQYNPLHKSHYPILTDSFYTLVIFKLKFGIG